MDCVLTLGDRGRGPTQRDGRLALTNCEGLCGLLNNNWIFTSTSFKLYMSSQNIKPGSSWLDEAILIMV